MAETFLPWQPEQMTLLPPSLGDWLAAAAREADAPAAEQAELTRKVETAEVKAKARERQGERGCRYRRCGTAGP